MNLFLLHTFLSSLNFCAIRGYSTIWKNSNDITVKQVYYSKTMRFLPFMENEEMNMKKLKYGVAYEATFNEAGFISYKPIKNLTEYSQDG